MDIRPKEPDSLPFDTENLALLGILSVVVTFVMVFICAIRIDPHLRDQFNTASQPERRPLLSPLYSTSSQERPKPASAAQGAHHSDPLSTAGLSVEQLDLIRRMLECGLSSQAIKVAVDSMLNGASGSGTNAASAGGPPPYS